MKFKINRRIFCILFALIISISAAAAFAADMPRLADNAGLLSDSEKSEVLETLDKISERQEADIVIVTTDALGGKTPESYADDFYDYNGYGYGSEHDGMLLLVSTEDNDWQISTCGFAMTAVTDDGIAYISEKFLPYMKDGDYAKAFTVYAELCDEFIGQAKTGHPYGGANMPKEPFNTPVCLAVAFGIGIAVSLIATGIMRSKLKSVKKQSAAASYVKANSMNITESRDIFLYNTTSRSEKTQTSSSGSSSSHTSSSGRTHGGGGGKF